MSLFTKAVKLSTRAIKKGGSNKARGRKGKEALAKERLANKAQRADSQVKKNRQYAGGAAKARGAAIDREDKKLKKLKDRYEKNPTPKLKEDIQRVSNVIGNMKKAQKGEPDAYGKGANKKDIRVKGTAGSLPKDKATLVHQGKVRKAGDKVGVQFLKKQPVKVDPKAPKETLPPMKKQLTLKSLNKLREKKGLPPLKKLPNIGGRVKKIKRAKGGVIKTAKASWMDGLTKKQIDEILGRPTRDSSGVKTSKVKKPTKIRTAKAGGTVKPKKSVYKTGGTIKRKSGGKIGPQRGWGKARTK